MLLPRTPRRPMASQTLRAITRIRSSAPMLLDDAVTCPWVAWNTDAAVNAILFDIDHDDGPDLVEDLVRRGCPAPALILDPWSGRSHAVLPLATPVLTTEGARPGPRIILDLATRLLATALRATILPQTALTKSPWGLTKHLIGAHFRRGPRPAVPALWEAHQEANTGLMWHTIPGDGPAELREIVAALVDLYGEEAPRPTRKRFVGKVDRGEPSALGRNCSLFDQVRWWAYDHEERDAGAIQAYADQVNSGFPVPLPVAEVACTVRSIARFMTSRFRPRRDRSLAAGRDRHLTAGKTLREAQGIAARRTNEARRATTADKLRAGLERLRAADAPLTQEALAAAAGLSLRTVKGWWRRPGMVQDGVPSGSAPRSEAPSSLAARSLPRTSSLAEIAGRDRSIRRVVRALEAAAAAMRRRGARPVDLPPIPREIALDPSVRRARRAAEAARADARRREHGRAARKTAQAAAREREAMYRGWAASPQPWARFRAWIAEQADCWEMRAEAARDDGDPAEAAAIRERSRFVLAAYERTWRRISAQCGQALSLPRFRQSRNAVATPTSSRGVPPSKRPRPAVPATTPQPKNYGLATCERVPSSPDPRRRSAGALDGFLRNTPGTIFRAHHGGPL